MIKSISGTNQVVVNASPFSPYINMSNPSAGMVRYNGNSHYMEVYDGTSWYPLTNHASIDLSPNANAAVLWAIDKMTEEAELKELANTHPAIRSAYDAYKRAGEQLKATIILSKDESLETHR